MCVCVCVYDGTRGGHSLIYMTMNILQYNNYTVNSVAHYVFLATRIIIHNVCTKLTIHLMTTEQLRIYVTGASFIVITHFKNMNTTMVIAMATNEIATPTFPMIPNARMSDSEIWRGLALSRMAK